MAVSTRGATMDMRHALSRWGDCACARESRCTNACGGHAGAMRRARGWCNGALFVQPRVWARWVECHHGVRCNCSVHVGLRWALCGVGRVRRVRASHTGCNMCMSATTGAKRHGDGWDVPVALWCSHALPPFSHRREHVRTGAGHACLVVGCRVLVSPHARMHEG